MDGVEEIDFIFLDFTKKTAEYGLLALYGRNNNLSRKGGEVWFMDYL